MIQPLFPTLIYSSRIPTSLKSSVHDRLEKESYAFRDLDEAGKSWSEENYIQGYTSYSSLDDLPKRSPTFKSLQKWIDGEVKAYVEKLKWDVNPKQIQMSTCWVNIMGYACHHSFHLHPGSVISGTYFVKVPE